MTSKASLCRSEDCVQNYSHHAFGVIDLMRYSHLLAQLRAWVPLCFGDKKTANAYHPCNRLHAYEAFFFALTGVIGLSQVRIFSTTSSTVGAVSLGPKCT